ncbi:PAAR domain-containing protein [Pseudomonas promysalinigenes]|uniref:PAAR domain-containing protein n=1 Tax=Pseudomonas promysalinigenes TaxID=485898 RepID=UPI0037C813E6
MARISIHGKGQALEGDLTTTGAVCVASITNYRAGNRLALRLGDVTTTCPKCKEPGVIVEGVPFFNINGKPGVVDEALVKCGCPNGSNRVIAQSARSSAVGYSTHATLSGPATRYSSSSSTQAPVEGFTAFERNSTAVVEPGFHIVRRSMSFEQVLQSLGTTHKPLPVSLLRRLNPTFAEGFKAGEIFVLGSLSSGYACSFEENELVMVAEKARESLSILTPEDANFMMEHLGEIAGVLSGASQSMGVGKDMLERGLSQVKDTLKGIQALHQRQFALHGNLNSPEFFAIRKQLYKQLDSQLRTAFLNKPLGLGSYDKLRRDLGISTKSVVHHWKKAGAPGQIPGYATHLDDVARVSKYLKYGGWVGVGLGVGSSYLKVYEACRAGETEECQKIRFTESGSFAGGLAGGALGAAAGKSAATAVCKFGAWGKAACGIVIVGGAGFGMSKGVEEIGEFVGETIYQVVYD